MQPRQEVRSQDEDAPPEPAGGHNAGLDEVEH